MNKNSLKLLQRRFKDKIKTSDLSRLDTGMQVYKSAYWLRMLESLEEDFPLVKKKLGDKKFKRTCEDFLKQNPSTYASLAEPSAAFPGFLKNITVQRLAVLEWKRNISFLARNPAPLKKGYFSLHSSVQFLDYRAHRLIIFRDRLGRVREKKIKDLKLWKFVQSLKVERNFEEIVSILSALKLSKKNIERHIEWLSKNRIMIGNFKNETADKSLPKV